MRGKIRVISLKESLESQLDIDEEFFVINCTSRSSDSMMAHGLSPFYLGPVECYDGLTASCVENAWQYAKVYPDMVDGNGNPTKKYIKWRDEGFAMSKGNRYPKGKGAIPLYSYWKVNGTYCKLNYVQARKLIYIPSYAKAVITTEAFERLNSLLDSGMNIALADFDGYNNFLMNMTYKDAANFEQKTFGHSFVIAMLLENLISVKNGEVIYSDKLKNM